MMALQPARWNHILGVTLIKPGIFRSSLHTESKFWFDFPEFDMITSLHTIPDTSINAIGESTDRACPPSQSPFASSITRTPNHGGSLSGSLSNE